MIFIKTTFMKIIHLLSAFIFASTCIAQSFETTINAPAPMLSCNESKLMRGVKVAEVNNTYLLVSHIQTNFSFCTPSAATGYSISRLTLTGDTLFNRAFMHPDFETQGNGRLTVMDVVVGNDSSIYILGYQECEGTTCDPVTLSKHTINGDLLWRKSYTSAAMFPRKMFIDDTTLFFAGESETAPSVFCLSVAQLDTAGTINWIGQGGAGYFPNISKIIKRTNDFVVVATSVQFPSVNNYRPYIVPFNYNWIDNSPIEFLGSSASSSFPDYNDAIYTANNTLLLAAPEIGTFGVHLIEIDDANQEVSYQVHYLNNPSGYVELKGIAQKTDLTFALVCNRHFYDPLTSLFYGTTISAETIDLALNQYTSSEYAGSAAFVLPTASNGIVIAGNRFSIVPAGEISTKNSLLLELDPQGMTSECSPHFIPAVNNIYFSDSLVEGQYLNLLNNSQGEASNFHWEINGVTIPFAGHNTSFLATTPGWQHITLVGCGQSYSDSVFMHASTAGLQTIQQNDIRLFPNPATDQFQVSGITGNLSVFDITGKCVLRAPINPSTSCNIEHLTSGRYTVVIENDEQTVVSELVIR